MNFDTQEVERKTLAILRTLNRYSEPVGARVISRELEDYGIRLKERSVRYHLKLMDQRGLTTVNNQDGRMITQTGREELRGALVQDKIGLAMSRIELLSFRTTFDISTGQGLVPVNVSVLSKENLPAALHLMRQVCAAGLCVSDLVLLAEEGQQVGDLTVPAGRVALGTVCSVVVNGALLKMGVPIDSRFGGILEMRDGQPHRFLEIIHYNGSSMDPSEVFIRGKMTDVLQMASNGHGKILANFREIPAACRSRVEEVMAGLSRFSIRGLLIMGEPSQPVCEINLDLNRIGMVLVGGLNPVAAVEEAGITTDNYPMSSLVEYRRLVKISEL